MNCYDEFATTNMFCAGSTHICTNSPLRDNMFSFWDQFSQLSFVGVGVMRVQFPVDWDGPLIVLFGHI